MRSSLLGVGALSITGLSSLVGCGLPPSDDGRDAEASSQTATAIVVVERSIGPGEAVRGDTVVARFVRVRQGAVDDSALRLAGVTQDFPAQGTCVTTLDAPAALPRQVDLLDVGGVSLEASAGRSTSLLPRAMPDPAGVVSGVFYSARTADAFATGSRVQLRATGGADLETGFTASVTSPHDLGDVAVTASNAGLDVSWDATDSEARDLVYVDVSASSRLVARCAAADNGRLLIPAANVANVDEGEVAVHRLRREAFRAKGIDPGEIRFDLSRVVAFRR